MVTLALSPDELETLTRIVGERFLNEPVDPRWADSVRLLLEKLRTARPGEPTSRHLRSRHGSVWTIGNPRRPGLTWRKGMW